MTTSAADCALRRDGQDRQQADRHAMARLQPAPTGQGILISPSLSAAAWCNAAQPLAMPSSQPEPASRPGTLLHCLTLDTETNELLKDIDVLDHEISNTMASLGVAVAATAGQHTSLLDALAVRKSRLVFKPGESLVAQAVLTAQMHVKSL